MQTQELARTHDVIDPGHPVLRNPAVVLLSTVSAAGAVNLMPMSSAFWLGHTGVLGMGTRDPTSGSPGPRTASTPMPGGR